ncbi:hypothetical protein GSI_09046 [Ganoderma sinense ZZ0214-1]|uniref:Uncharacterized protein n=1 Tax=Ganoderma sinense ZZ0214-1 TaxID=1077348 RepID=A0A2G8S5D8_9APHY|nr:hypothetical protein GSI_09046 [Ganoderma sinense ZZ0214-1]
MHLAILLELGGAKNQPNVSQPLVLICVGKGDCDESKLHSFAARAPRRRAQGTTASSPSRTSTIKSLSPSRSSTHSPSPRSAESQPSPATGGHGHHTTESRTTSVATGSALGKSTPSVIGSPEAATTSSHSKVHRVSPKTIIAVIMALIVVVLIVVVIVGLVLWWRKRAGKGQRGEDYRALKVPSLGDPVGVEDS